MLHLFKSDGLMILYKIGNYAYRKNIPLMPWFINLLIRLVHNSAVYSQTEIGKGTIFGYGGIGIVIHKRVEIGQRCVIGSNVTIGGKSKSEGVPVIGSDVYISTGAKILGDVNIGDNSVVGANAVVINNVPPNSVVVGVPARVIKSGIRAEDFY